MLIYFIHTSVDSCVNKNACTIENKELREREREREREEHIEKKI